LFKKVYKAMNTDEYIELFDDLDNEDQLQSFLNKGRKQKYPPRNPKKMPDTDYKFLAKQDDSSRSFKFAYKAARFEEWWLLESLGDFYEHKWITDVLRRLKGGKEASVYLCQASASSDARLLTAKVYRPRSLRNLKNDGIYRTGRADLDEDGNALVKEGNVNAIIKRTKYGEELRHQSWISYEFKTLEMLHEAGADVPKPYTMEKNAILMEYIGDYGTAAPTLNSVSLDRGETRRLFDRIILNLNLLLQHKRIHGDLSAYNILYWDDEITLIDFPQVVHPEMNPSAWVIFLRDVTRVCQYFQSQGIKVNARSLAADIWTSHGYKVVQDVHPGHLDAESTKDRQLWENQKSSK
jgi:RIO kinase 1